MANFDIAFDRLIDHEKGWSNDKNDPGNWTGGKVGAGLLKGTKFGIAANTYPNLDIKNLTLAQAKQIYYQDWWLKIKADVLPFPIVYQLWDFAVNSGMDRASRCLQKVVGFKGSAIDGVIGSQSISRINEMAKTNLNDILILLTAERIKFMVNLSNWGVHGRGWMNRVALNLEYAAKDNNEK